MKINARLLDSATYRYSFDMQSRYGDIDSQQHLNNSRIGEFYQEGRVRFFTGLGRQLNVQSYGELRVLVAHISIDYVAEIFYPQDVSVKLGIAAIGRTSITLQMALFSEGKCAGLAKVVVVNADAKGPAPIADDWRAALDAYRLPADALAPA